MADTYQTPEQKARTNLDKVETSSVLIGVLEAPSQSLTLDQYQDLAPGTDRTAGKTPQSLDFAVKLMSAFSQKRT